MQASPQRILYFIWLLALAVLLSACSVSEDPHANPANGAPGNVLRIDVDCDFGSFHPQMVNCSGSTYVFPFIYSVLCVRNPEGGLEPDLAANWDYDPKTFTWRIELRRDARFHNGVPVTAADAAYSIRFYVENKRAGFDRKIRKIAATSKYVLEIQLKQDGPSFLNSLWDIDIVPDSGRHANLDLKVSPVGSGPFKFDRRTDDGRVILSANEHYYKGRPAIDRVVFYHIPRREDSWSRLIKGETDIAGNLTVKDYEIIEQYADRFYSNLKNLALRARSEYSGFAIYTAQCYSEVKLSPQQYQGVTHESFS